MSVWYAIPSKRPVSVAENILELWAHQGYRLAVWRDFGDDPVRADLVIEGSYFGYARAVNALCGLILRVDDAATWIVTGGDDVEPDRAYDADEIGAECTAHFGGTFGVMQPTGDRWGADEHQPNVRPDRRAYIDRVAGSPWLGRDWCARMYGGQGPLWSGWQHMFEDEELQAVAERRGVFWQRPDLIHLHRHWARERKPEPEYLKAANSTFHQAQALFRERAAAGFPGHEPLP